MIQMVVGFYEVGLRYVWVLSCGHETVEGRPPMVGGEQVECGECKDESEE